MDAFNAWWSCLAVANLGKGTGGLQPPTVRTGAATRKAAHA